MRSPFPALNVRRRNEYVATDTIFSDVTAIDNGATCAQIFVGISTKYCEAIGMKMDGEFFHALMDNIRKIGAMDKIVTDGGEALISTKVENILRHLCIKNWQTKPYDQHQSASEQLYKDIKLNLNRILNSSCAPANCWLLCLSYTIFVMNCMVLQYLQWRTPYEPLN